MSGWFGLAAFQEFGVEGVKDSAFLLAAAEETVEDRAAGL